MQLLASETARQAILLPALFLLMAVVAALVGCNTTAPPPVPAETTPLLTAQSTGEVPEPDRDTPEPQSAPIPKPAGIPDSEPTTTVQASPTPTPEPARNTPAHRQTAVTPTAKPTHELDCTVDTPEGKVCVEPPEPIVTPKYPIFRNYHLNSYAIAAEEAAKSSSASGRSEAETRVVMVEVELTNEGSTYALVAWLESNNIPKYENRSANDAGWIARFFPERDEYSYVYAYIPAYLLAPLAQQEGISAIKDACLIVYDCEPEQEREPPPEK